MTLDNIKIPLRKFKDPRYVNAANTANITESGAYFQVRKYGSTTMGILKSRVEEIFSWFWKHDNYFILSAKLRHDKNDEIFIAFGMVNEKNLF